MENFDLSVASDHSGFDLKTKIIKLFKDKKILDLGTYGYESVDYPDYAQKMIKTISKNKFPGILICGTGIGMSIAANRHPSIRAALCFNKYMAKKAKLHNNANILVLGSDIISADDLFDIIDIFLNTKFEPNSRYEKRINKIC